MSTDEHGAVEPAAGGYPGAGTAGGAGYPAEPEVSPTADDVAAGRRVNAADVRAVRFPRAHMVHPGYVDVDVDRFLARIADELDRLNAERADLRNQVQRMQDALDGVVVPEPPSEQAVRILAIAQQTADSYVAEAESFSRQATREAREAYEDQLRRARENAGAIIQAAQEAAEKMVASGAQPATGAAPGSPTEELSEQVAYLKAFAQACRTQLRAYLEALLVDVESEWGRADPAGLPQAPFRAPAQRSDRAPADVLNVAHERATSSGQSGPPATGHTTGPGPASGDGAVEVAGARSS